MPELVIFESRCPRSWRHFGISFSAAATPGSKIGGPAEFHNRPHGPGQPKDLDRIRAGIDAVDNGIVELLARRRTLVIELAQIKKTLDVPIYDRKREQALVDRVKKWGAEHKLNEEFVEVVFRLIVMNSKEVQYHESQ